MARTLDECKAIYDTYNQSEKVLYFCMQRMYDEKYIKGMQMIHSGLIGDVVGMRCHWFRNADWRRPVPSPELERKINWRLVELKARFDEARNLEKAEELQRSGVQVVYGVKGLKTHAKICLVVRREQGMLRRYCHFGTGNYNETTAKIYTDISYLTCDDQLGADASQFFNSVTGRTKLMRFRKLYPSPVLMKARLIELIEGEAERARQGEPARISAKMNSLQDVEIIDALYRAADAGVDIELNVRGICCLKTGPRPNGKVIRVVSIVDRYLEHARIFFFHHGGNHQLFIASADWMTRNLDKRVELMVPVTNGKLARRLKSILDACFRDNVQVHGRRLPPYH